MILHWLDDDPNGIATAETVTDLDHILDRLHDQAAAHDRPRAVTIYPSGQPTGTRPIWTGPCLTITVGTPHAIVTWLDNPNTPQPTALISSTTPRNATNAGDTASERDIAVDDRTGISIFPATALIPADDARAAARAFAMNGKRPQNLAWTTV